VVLLKNVVLDPTTEFALADLLAFQMSSAVPGAPLRVMGNSAALMITIDRLLDGEHS
jgi:hypothetical protein